MELNVPELFLDDQIVERTFRLGRTIHQLQKYGGGPLVRPDKPWEGHLLAAYGTVMLDLQSGLLRLWYNSFDRRPDRRRNLICYAQSRDGLLWEKPELGLVEVDGSTRNNVVMYPTHVDCLNVICEADEERPHRRYKMFYYKGGETAGYYVAYSPDGLRWEARGEPVMTEVGDRHNLIYNDSRPPYRVLCRERQMMTAYRGRAVSLAESEDFEHWSKPKLVLAPDLTDGPDVQFYSCVATRYAGCYVGFLEVLHSERDVMTTRLVTSRDGRAWKQVGNRAEFLAPGPPGHWDCVWTSVVGGSPIPQGENLLVYYSGRTEGHGLRWPQPWGALSVGVIRRDGFCSISAGPTEGELVTKPLCWPGGCLWVNASMCRRPHVDRGELRVEILDEGENVAPGFGCQDATPLCGNLNYALCAWGDKCDLSDLEGRTIRLRFLMRQAELYSFKAAPRSR